MNRSLLALLVVPSLALATVSGTVTLLDGTPVSGTVLKIGTDSAISSASGGFTLGRTTSISGRAVRTVPVTAHLSIENGHPRLSWNGSTLDGRTFSGRRLPAATAAARALAESPDTLTVHWKGKRLVVLPIAAGDSTGITLKIDTAWKDDAGIPWNPRIEYGSIKDDRDGQTYRTVKIGSQRWMAENLNLRADSSWCYGNDSANCRRFGRLYLWAASLELQDSCSAKSCSTLVQGRHKGLCPKGWHIPADAQWDLLMETAGDIATAGKMLKSTIGWFTNGTDAFGFRGLPGLNRYYNGSFEGAGGGAWWSASESTERYAGHVYFYSDAGTRWTSVKSCAYSLRCLED